MQTEGSTDVSGQANAALEAAAAAEASAQAAESSGSNQQSEVSREPIIGSCDIQSSRLDRSPLGAGKVNYIEIRNFYGSGERVADEDPTFACKPPPAPQRPLYSQAQLYELQQRLLERRVLFLLYESSGVEQLRNVRDQLTNAMVAQAHVYRTTVAAKPLKFSLLRSQCSKFKYAEAVILDIPIGDIRGNVEFLDRPELTAALAESLTIANACAIVPVSRSEVPRFDEHVSAPSCYVWPVKEALAARKQAAAAREAGWDYDQPILNTVQFTIANFPGLPQNEFSSLVQQLLKAQQKRLDDAAGLEERPARRVKASLMRRWLDEQDRVIAQCQATYSREEGSRGSYAFKDPARADIVREQLVSEARGWCAQQLTVALDTYLSEPAPSEAFQHCSAALALMAHEHQLDTIDQQWLWEKWQKAQDDSRGATAQYRFQDLFYSLLGSRQIRDTAQAFLRGLVPKANAAKQRWVEIYYGIDAVRLYEAEEDSQIREQLAKHIESHIDAMSALQLAPLREMGSVHRLIINALSVESAEIILPILLECMRDSAEEQKLAVRFRKATRLAYVTRAAQWSVFLALREYLSTYPDLLLEYGRAVVAHSTREKGAEDTGIQVLLDVLHEVTRQTLWADNKHSDDDRRRLCDRFFDATDGGDLAAILAKSVIARSPEEEAMLLIPGMRPQPDHIIATATFYANLIDTLLRVAGDNVAAVRPRVRQLIEPLNSALTARQRTDMRRMLSSSEEYYRRAGIRSNGTGARELSKSAQRFVEGLCLMRGAVA